MKRFLRVVAALLLLGPCVALEAAAAFTCTTNVASTPISYQDNALATSTQATLTVSCTRGANNDPLTLTYSVAAPGPGNNFSGTRRASAVIGGTTYYTGYTLGTASGCVAAWSTAGAFTGTFTWIKANDKTTQVGIAHSYFVCIPQQTGSSLAATNANPAYADTFAITVNNSAGGAVIGSGSHSVAITVTPICTFPTIPSTINIAYTTFQASQVTASTPFQLKCTTTDGYTVAVSPTSGTAAGLNYTLDVLDSFSAVVAPATTLTGTGASQNFSIRATVPAGQSGCTGGSCPASQAHTLTISY
jgi:hypothetical protein